MKIDDFLIRILPPAAPSILLNQFLGLGNRMHSTLFKIVVLYNSCNVMRDTCPEVLRYKGTHLAAIFRDTDGKLYWNVGGIAQALRA